MKTRRNLFLLIGFLVLQVLQSAQAGIIDVTIDGGDAIWLAGRTDLVIPAASDPWPGGLARHVGSTPEEILETMPSFINVAAGDVIKVLDPAVGGINFFNGFGPGFFGPQGNGGTSSSITPFGGISGYVGTQGPLVGVFLNNSVPSAGPPPPTLDFASTGLGLDFASLSPDLSQVFFIGDGVTASNIFQQFIAPLGATRLFLGVPDAFGFSGGPGAYDDNDGSYRIRVGVNETPDNPTGVPEPATLTLLLFGLVLLAFKPLSSKAP